MVTLNKVWQRSFAKENHVEVSYSVKESFLVGRNRSVISLIELITARMGMLHKIDTKGGKVRY